MRRKPPSSPKVATGYPGGPTTPAGDDQDSGARGPISDAAGSHATALTDVTAPAPATPSAVSPRTDMVTTPEIAVRCHHSDGAATDPPAGCGPRARPAAAGPAANRRQARPPLPSPHAGARPVGRGAAPQR